MAVYPPGAGFGPRRMRDFEFVWMVEGDAVYLRDGERTDAPRGSIVLCRPGAVDGFEWDRRTRTRHAYFHFQVHAVPRDWPPQSLWPLVRRPPDDDILRPMFRHILAGFGKAPPAHQAASAAHLLSAFVLDVATTGELPRATTPAATA